MRADPLEGKVENIFLLYAWYKERAITSAHPVHDVSAGYY